MTETAYQFKFNPLTLSQNNPYDNTHIQNTGDDVLRYEVQPHPCTSLACTSHTVVQGSTRRVVWKVTLTTTNARTTSMFCICREISWKVFKFVWLYRICMPVSVLKFVCRCRILKYLRTWSENVGHDEQDHLQRLFIGIHKRSVPLHFSLVCPKGRKYRPRSVMYPGIRWHHSAISESSQRISRPIISPVDWIKYNADGPRIPEANVIPGPVSARGKRMCFM